MDMNTRDIVKYGLFVTIVVLFVNCSSRFHNHIPRLMDGMMYPTYFLDTITIPEPRLVVYNDSLFVMSESILDLFIDNPLHRPQGPTQCVFPIFPRDLRFNFSTHVYGISDFSDRISEQYRFSHDILLWDYNECVTFKSKINNIEIYEFTPAPSKFALILSWDDKERAHYEPIVYKPLRGYYLNKVDSLDHVSFTPKHEPKYVLTVSPLYSRETINKHNRENYVLIQVTKRSGERYYIPPIPELTEKEVRKAGLPDL